MRPLVTTAAAFGAALALGVTLGSVGTPPPDGVRAMPDVLLASAELAPFEDCDELTAFMTEAAEASMEGEALVVDDMVVDMEFDLVEEAAPMEGRAAAEPPAEPAAEADVGGPDATFSETNVQEAGIDEPDLVKTDGRLIVTVAGGHLHVVDLAGGLGVVGTVELPGGWGHELLLVGDRALVLTTGAEIIAFDMPEGSGTIRELPDRLEAQAVLVDLADPAHPEVISRVALEGSYASARLVDGVARIVLRAEPVGLPFESPEGDGLRAEREATERNREIVRRSTIDNWVPYYVHEADGREREGTLLACDRIHHPEVFAGLGTTSVLSLDLAGDLSPQGATGVLAGGETVYASPDRLYVATNHWIDWAALSETAAEDASERFTTDLHGFDITDPAAARYVGSGNVRGHVLNQWALSEHEGVLRVATTEGSPWWGWEEDRPLSESFVTTFEERDGALVERGQVGGLGLDERIYAVRFMGDIGYVVTFRETDPLYTLDLSDPAAPRVLGELKIMGYSAYLHPVGEGLVLGVGQDADEGGATKGLQLSLFDVSDLADPQRIHQVTLDDAHSGVEWDHHAFLHWPATGLTVVPYETWRWVEESDTEETDSGALAYTLDRASGFTDVGRLTHLPADIGDSTDPRYWDVAWRAPIRRSIVIGDALYTVSDLDRKRREVTDTARRGVAHIRDTDGTGLVLLRAHHYQTLDTVSRWHDRLAVVDRARAKPAPDRGPSDFGDLTWLRHLDDDDLATFVAEIRAAVSVAYHDDDLTELEQLVHDWRVTANELADRTRREVLLGGFDSADYVEVTRPEA
jgi:uncharacterized secreted protein with C-terminal beta-propeller domain